MAERARGSIPRYSELPLVPGTGEHHAWDVWGRDDQLGAINHIDDAKVRAACASVRHGRVIPLGLPLDEPAPGLFPSRRAYEHTLIPGSHGWDDRLDGFYPQFSTQWDGLRHVRFGRHGYWGGRQEADLERGDLGIERWARHGMLTRGVLLDAAAFLAGQGRPIDPRARITIGAATLDAIAEAQGTSVQPGDAVLVRTGWLPWYRSLGPDERAQLLGSVGRAPAPLACPGLASADAAAWLWDRQVSAVAADNPTVEALPVDRHEGFLHYRLIPLLGMALGEFWFLEELAQACSTLSQYTFLLASSPLDVPGGVGSPANAHAII